MASGYLGNLWGYITSTNTTASILSTDFGSLITKLADCNTKQEEVFIIEEEIKKLKNEVNVIDFQNVNHCKEFILRLMYCEMLGYRVNFGHVAAVNMTQHENLSLKRLGYLAASLFLYEDHPLMILLVSSLTRDLRSNNAIEVWTGLTALCSKLVSKDQSLPSLIPLVVNLLSHKKHFIRCKSVGVLHRLWREDPSLLSNIDLTSVLSTALCDKDVNVMSASLSFYVDLIKKNAVPFKTITSIFLSILEQILERKLPPVYEFHGVPSPWLQIKILNILAMLGANDKKASELMYSILENMGNKLLKSNKTAEFAVLYQFIHCITSIYPTSSLLTIAFNAITLYFTTNSPNLNYFGIKSIIQLMKVDVSYANNFQEQVLECIEHSDESIRRLTLSILFELSNQKNVEVIVEKLVSVLKKTQEQFLKKELVHKIIQIVQRFSPSLSWSLTTICILFDIAADTIDNALIQELLELFADVTIDTKFEEVLSNILKSLKENLVDSYLQFFVGIVSVHMSQMSKEFLSSLANECIKLLDDETYSEQTQLYLSNFLISSLFHGTVSMELLTPVIAKAKHSQNIQVSQYWSELYNFDRLSMQIAAIGPYSTESIEKKLSEYTGSAPFEHTSASMPDLRNTKIKFQSASPKQQRLAHSVILPTPQSHHQWNNSPITVVKTESKDIVVPKDSKLRSIFINNNL